MTPEQKLEEHETKLETFQDKVRALAKEHGIDTGLVAATAVNPANTGRHILIQFFLFNAQGQLDLEEKARLGQIIAQSETCQQALKLYRSLHSGIKRTKKKK